MAVAVRPVRSISAAVCSAAMACLTVWYAYPDLVSKYIASSLDAFAGLKAWLTAPILFILMNGVVMSLAFTSGFLSRRQLSDYGEEPKDLARPREHFPADGAGEREKEEEEEEGHRKDEEEEDEFYPEALSCFFGDGGTTACRKPVLQRSASVPSAERNARSFYPSISSSSSSQKLSSGHSLAPGTNAAATSAVNSEPLRKVLRPAHTIPKPTFEHKKSLSVIKHVNVNGGDKDVDQRADAFIGDFYKKMKLQQVDPYLERRLERSYGR